MRTQAQSQVFWETRADRSDLLVPRQKPGNPIGHGSIWSERYSIGPYLGDVSFASAPYCYRCQLGLQYPKCGIQCAKMVEDAINYSTSACVAAFIAEPILGEGDIIVPPREYFSKIKEIVDRYGILLIDD